VVDFNCRPQIAHFIALLCQFPAFGSIIGGIFAFLNKKSDLDTKRLELEHERNKWAHDLQVKDKDLDYARIEAQGRKEVAICRR
jgi:hypothetical protein